MKQKSFLTKILAVLLATAFLTAYPAHIVALAADSSQTDEYAGMTAEEKQAAIEQKIKELDSKLSSLGKESKETKEYIDALDEKISYLKKQLDYSENKIEASKKKINDLQQQYKDNEAQIAELTTDVANLEAQNAQLEQTFSQSLALYYQRIRAIYVSGETSTIAMLLTCPDISTLLTRYEMIKRVSKCDKELLQSVQSQATELSKTRLEMQDKQTTLQNDQVVLKTTQQNLTTSISTLETQQEDYSKKQDAYQTQKSESDKLLKQLDEQKQTYSEYRNQDQAELDAVNAEIAKAAEAYQKKLEAEKKKTTTTKATSKATTTTTKKSDEGGNGGATTTTKHTTTTTEEDNSDRLKMTYPVPSQTKITCGYGSAGYAGHTGVDFSCAANSKVVAAESGYVIVSKDLTNSDGTYRSYGRYIVIMHDKKDSAGNYVYTLYAHNNSRLVSEGQYVKKGQQIAWSGSTGNSTGPHCHFEVRTPTANYSDCVNPTFYLP